MMSMFDSSPMLPFKVKCPCWIQRVRSKFNTRQKDLCQAIQSTRLPSLPGTEKQLPKTRPRARRVAKLQFGIDGEHISSHWKVKKSLKQKARGRRVQTSLCYFSFWSQSINWSKWSCFKCKGPWKQGNLLNQVKRLVKVYSILKLHFDPTCWVLSFSSSSSSASPSFPAALLRKIAMRQFSRSHLFAAENRKESTRPNGVFWSKNGYIPPKKNGLVKGKIDQNHNQMSRSATPWLCFKTFRETTHPMVSSSAV